MDGVTKTKAVERLQKLLDEASELEPLDHRSQKFKKWTNDIYSAFSYIFGDDSRQFQRLPGGFTINPSGIRDYVSSMASAVASSLDDVKYFWTDDKGTMVHLDKLDDHETFNTEENVQQFNKKGKVFIVHGHDSATREMVARFLEKLELEPIILHEQPNRGRTIIEKFEDYSEVEFAIILLTPDDIGTVKDSQHDLKPRARQNVILELGFFLGKLGRRRVCPLVTPDVETPSDYDGVVYTVLDDTDGWKMKLVRELVDTGFTIDTDRVFQL